jgi:hypothetical protein
LLSFRRVHIGLPIFALAVMSALISAPAHASSGSVNAGIKRVDRVISWESHDRVSYVVTTLNSVRCPTGLALPRELHRFAGARSYQVMQSTRVRNLYFIRAEAPFKITAAVYAFRIGWKVPGRVVGGGCGRRVRARWVTTMYRSHAWHLNQTFKTTTPRS